MTISVKIVCDSVAPSGTRLTTFVLTYPRFIHSEFMTHRLISKNSASSRAIPLAKMREIVSVDPAMPVWWGKNQKGMQAPEELSGEKPGPYEASPRTVAKDAWLWALEDALKHHKHLEQIGLHKQIANRILEPWMHMTTIATATEWENFFLLRCHPDAQPEFRDLAELMRHVYRNSSPQDRAKDAWHLPFIDVSVDWPLADSLAVASEQYTSLDIIKRVSVGRCARVSYLTHEGKRDLVEDMRLCASLLVNKHMSPFEHVAQALDTNERWGNFEGWKQYRKFIDGEHAGREIRK